MQGRVPYELNALVEGGTSVVTERVDIELFRIVTNDPPPISKYLQENDSHLAEPGTILHYLLRLYQSAGWKRVETNPSSRGGGSSITLDPILELPSIEYNVFYTVLGISTDSIENFFRKVQKDFQLSLLLLELCREFGKELSKCFPSRRNEVCNQERNVERSSSRIPSSSSSKRGEETETMTKTREERQRKNREKRQRKLEHLERKFPRIIPIHTLPLVLSRLPDFYQAVNITLAETELLEKRLWSQLDFRSQFDDYVKTQVELMKHNRRYLNFHSQFLRQSKYDQKVDDYECRLKDAELLWYNQLQRECWEKERECDEKIARRIKKMKTSS